MSKGPRFPVLLATPQARDAAVSGGLAVAAGRSRLWRLSVVSAVHRGSIQGQAKAAKGGSAAAGRRAVPVVVAVARSGDMPVYINGLGTVTALNTVTVRSRVDGELINVAYQEGQYVKAGDLLAEIDPRPFQAQLELAQGQLAKDQAQTRPGASQPGARYRAAQVCANRIRPLRQAGGTRNRRPRSRRAIEVQRRFARGNADGRPGRHLKARGPRSWPIRRRSTPPSFNWCTASITAPLAGRIGLRLVDKGNIVHATDTNGLAVITQLQPIAVVFNIPEDSLRQVMPKFSAGVKFPVLAYDRDLRRRLADRHAAHHR